MLKPPRQLALHPNELLPSMIDRPRESSSLIETLAFEYGVIPLITLPG